jgi:hypothetical protein
MGNQNDFKTMLEVDTAGVNKSIGTGGKGV